MPLYNVDITESEIYRLEGIAAESEEEAVNQAYALIDSEEGKQQYHANSDGEYETTEVGE